MLCWVKIIGKESCEQMECEWKDLGGKKENIERVQILCDRGLLRKQNSKWKWAFGF